MKSLIYFFRPKCCAYNFTPQSLSYAIGCKYTCHVPLIRISVGGIIKNFGNYKRYRVNKLTAFDYKGLNLRISM